MEISNKTITYTQSLAPEQPLFIQSLESYAKEHNVPIMEPQGMETLLQFLRIHKPKRILEIGTAIGYSAIRMLETVPDSHVLSIERDKERGQLAKQNILEASLDTRFDLIFGDALEVVGEVSAKAPFDVLFIDAAKGQYERFFSLYEPFVKEGGIIFSDNVLFKGMVSGEVEAETRGVRSLVKKIKTYNETLMRDERFISIIIPVGDGLMVSKKVRSEENRQVK